MVSVQVEGKNIGNSPLTFEVFDNPFTQARLLYDASVHGYKNSVFHRVCDNVNGTVTVVSLKNGARFGGYNPSCWTSENRYKKVPGAFLFSLTDGKGGVPRKFSLKEGLTGNSICCHADYGPVFGEGETSSFLPPSLVFAFLHSFFLSLTL